MLMWHYQFFKKGIILALSFLLVCRIWHQLPNNLQILFVDVPTSSIEIERLCDKADESILETAAVSVAPINGGPEQLVIYVVLKSGYNFEAEILRMKLSKAIQNNHNPLFKV